MYCPKGCRIARAVDIQEGDRVVLQVPPSSYIVDRVEVSPMGVVRFCHGDDTGSNGYWPGELLFVAIESNEVTYARG